MPTQNLHSQDLQAALKIVEAHLSQLPSLERELATLQAKKQQLEASVAEEQARLDGARQKADSIVQAANIEAAKLVADAESARTAILDEVEELHVEVSDLQEKVESLNIEATQETTRLTEAKEEQYSLKTELSLLQQKIDELTTTIPAKQDEVGRLDTDIESRKSDLTMLHRSIDNAQKELDDLQADSESRREKVEAELKDLMVKTTEVAERLKELEMTEQTTRKSLAADRVALDKEREVVERMKEQVSADHARISKHRTMAKL